MLYMAGKRMEIMRKLIECFIKERWAGRTIFWDICMIATSKDKEILIFNYSAIFGMVN